MEQATRLVPLEIELVDSGVFLQTSSKDLMGLQVFMRNYRKKYGKLADGAKGKLVMEIEITACKDDENAFLVKATNSVSVPKRPSVTNMTMAGETQTNEPCLLVRSTGGSFDRPDQGILTDGEGKPIAMPEPDNFDNNFPLDP